VDQEPGQVTQLLIQLQKGNRDAEATLIPLVYGELRRLAAFYLRGERSGHTLQPTALVHEAYIRLTEISDLKVTGRSHFFALAARLMRRILVDHARSHQAKKRGGLVETIRLEDSLIGFSPRAKELLALDDALNRLSQRDIRQGSIVELRFFGGLSEQETATILGISTRTVKRDWRIAKAWLYHEIGK
jgi:RNA polymerase sigma-70 factor, ECF subfamily